jgi:hypothetical protein
VFSLTELRWVRTVLSPSRIPNHPLVVKSFVSLKCNTVFRQGQIPWPWWSLSPETCTRGEAYLYLLCRRESSAGPRIVRVALIIAWS